MKITITNEHGGSLHIFKLFYANESTETLEREIFRFPASPRPCGCLDFLEVLETAIKTAKQHL